MTLKEAKAKGKLAQFIKEREEDTPPGNLRRFKRILKSIVRELRNQSGEHLGRVPARVEPILEFPGVFMNVFLGENKQIKAMPKEPSTAEPAGRMARFPVLLVLLRRWPIRENARFLP